MGIGPQIVEALLREHSFKPLRGDALLMGRQTVYYSPDEILAAFREHCVTPAIEPEMIELDKTTIDRLPGYEHRKLITDISLMTLFGVSKVMALDHSAYEGADVVHDLRYPLPADLCEVADILIDGSTLDNVFTPSTVIQNYSKLLRPNGRMFLLNAFSAYDTAYVVMPPMWYLDYFVMNGFADCRIYAMISEENKGNTFYIDLRDAHRLQRGMGRLISPYHTNCLVFAEKGGHSTTDKLPIQQDYRPESDWRVYQENLAAMLSSGRHHLARSYTDIFFANISGGHRYINREFEVDDRAVANFVAGLSTHA